MLIVLQKLKNFMKVLYEKVSVEFEKVINIVKYYYKE